MNADPAQANAPSNQRPMSRATTGGRPPIPVPKEVEFQVQGAALREATLGDLVSGGATLGLKGAHLRTRRRTSRRRSLHRADEGPENPPSAGRRGGLPPGRVLDSRSAAA